MTWHHFVAGAVAEVEVEDPAGRRRKKRTADEIISLLQHHLHGRAVISLCSVIMAPFFTEW